MRISLQKSVRDDRCLVTDGIFVREPGEPVVFREFPPPSDAEVTEVAWDACRRTRDILIRRGLWQDDDQDQARDEPPNAPEPGLAAIYQASIRGVLSLGPRHGQRVVRFYGQAARGVQDDPSSHRTGHEFDLHAKQAARDRAGLERLARYVLRAPLAQGRLELEPDGRILLQMKRSWRDGTTGMVFEPLDFLAKLTALVPYPRTNILRFHGVYAPHSALRRTVVPHREETAGHACRCGTPDDPTSRSLRLTDTYVRVNSLAEEIIDRAAWSPLDHATFRRMRCRVLIRWMKSINSSFSTTCCSPTVSCLTAGSPSLS